MKFLIFIFVFVAFNTGSGFAYIPPSQFIVKRMTSLHSGLKTIRVRSQVVAMEGDRETNVKLNVTTVVNLQTGFLRSWTSDLAGHELYRLFRSSASYTPAEAVLFGAQVQAVTQILKDAEIPLRTEEELLRLKDEAERRQAEVTSLGRWKGSVAWVVGSKGRPQLWVEKDRFLPMRLTFLSKPSEEWVDVQMEGFRFYREFPYPRWIRVSERDGTPLFREELIEFSPNPQTNDPKIPSSHGFTEEGNSASPQLKRLIEKYFEWIR